MTHAATFIPLLESAILYASWGWHVFPCQPRSKIPATPHGFKDATTDERLIRAWWEQNSAYNVAIATGEVSGIFVLDVDNKQGRSLDEALEPFPKIPATPTARTGGGGLQYFFKFPAGSNLSISGGKLGLGIDTRGNGGYVVAPPSVHPHGGTYQWVDSFDVADLAETPAWIVEKLEAQKTSAVLSSAEKLTGARHQTLMTGAALMRGIGLVPGEIYAALDQMRTRLDLSDGRVVTDKEIRDIADWCADKGMGTVNVEAVVHGEQVAQGLARHMGEAAAEMAVDATQDDPGPFPEHLMTVPGTIGDLCAFIARTSFKRQPVLALAAALAAFGTVIGRKVETPNGGRSNLYCIGVCKSGGGKERARQGVKEALTAAGADCYLGPEDLASEAGMLATLTLQPSVLFQIDEMGRMLRVLTDPKAAPHLVGIVSAWLKLYSNASSVYKGKAYADPEKNPIIHQPNACVYGTTVPDSLWAALGSESVTDGFLARCLIFQTNDHNPPKQKPEARRLPATLVEAIRWWHLQGYAAGGGGNLADKLTPTPRIVDRSPEAEEIFTALEQLARDEMTRLGGSPLEALWTRVEQKADQLALIYACSASREKPLVGVAAARWAADLAVYLTRRLEWDCHRHVAENETEATTKRVLRLIEAAGYEGLTRNDLTRRTQWLRGRKRELDEILRQIFDAGQIVMIEASTATRPKTVIKLAKYRDLGGAA